MDYPYGKGYNNQNRQQNNNNIKQNLIQSNDSRYIQNNYYQESNTVATADSMLQQNPEILEKVRLIVMQLNQIKSQLINLQRSPNPQAPEIYNQMMMKANYLTNLYIQLTGSPPPSNLQITSLRNTLNMSQPNLINQNQMAIQMMQQRMLSNQRMSMNNNNCPQLQRMPNQYYSNQNVYENSNRINDFRNNSRQQLDKKKSRLSDSETEEDFSSSPEPTRKEIDAMASLNGPVRRSTRSRKQKTYASYELDDELIQPVIKEKKEIKKIVSNIDNKELLPVGTENNDSSIAIIDKILGDRIRLNTEQNDEHQLEPLIEYYVKYKYYSYLHCEWVTLQEMKFKDRLAINKVKRYNQKKPTQTWQNIDDEYFNPDYIEIDRILSRTETTHTTINDPTKSDNNNNIVTTIHYLVKWCSLSYEDSTWEPEELLDINAINEFNIRENSFNPSKLNYISRPNISTWKELTQSPVYKNDNVLREYQLEGLNWLRYCYYRWQNCILADEMGLGKTIQSISFVNELYKLGIKGPFLIIAPLSTIHNWYREFRSWTDLNILIFHGSSYSRSIIHKYELFYYDNNLNIIPNVYKFDAIITTYEMILSELKFLSSVNWRLAIVDEAHRLKNKKCKLLESLSYLNLEHRVLLTGTPLQNSLEELYSLLSFLDPHNIPNEKDFLDEFANLQSNEQVNKLQLLLKPIMLRRLKEDVEKNIAPKEETIIEVEMTTIQKRIYRSILERNFSFLVKGTATSNMPNLMNTMMELRKCCNHPFLIKGCQDKIINEYSSNDTQQMAAYHLKWLIESSGKMVLVDKLLPKLKSNGHKVLLFSQMVKVLNLIEEYLIIKKYTYERIDGSIRGNFRQAAIDRFSRPDSDRFIFLLCTKAGGLGINLTAADTVIIFDSDWNPQNDIQAQARCHRIGQRKSVKVYRLICRRTYEREMFDRASLKLGLDKAVLQNMNNDDNTNNNLLKNDKNNLSKNDIESLLKRGAYGALMDEDVIESQQFCAEDIDQILERRSKIIQLAGENLGSTFAKASFNAQTKGDIDVDDPDFWEKWAIKAKISLENISNDLIFDTPRERKLINYDDQDDLDQFAFSESFIHNPYRFCWIRVECFKTEKQLLIFGYNRWDYILKNAGYKTRVTLYDIENISKTILVYCYHYAKMEISTKIFIENLINSTFEKDVTNENSYRSKQIKRLQNRKHRYYRDKQSPCAIEINKDWNIIDPNLLILDPGYRKHLQQNANKILLRIRLIYVLKNEILTENINEIMNNNINEISLKVKLPIFGATLTISSWWNEDCDKSLLIGTYKHGYEKYKEMLHDKMLIFERIIPKEALERQIELEKESSSLNQQININEPKKRGRKRKNMQNLKKINNENSDFRSSEDENIDEENNNILPLLGPEDWPQTADLNTRLRRLVTSFWKNKSTLEIQLKKLKPLNIISFEVRLLKKEENDFYKTLLNYGLEHIIENNTIEEVLGIKFIYKFQFIWENFRKINNFEKRDDLSLTQYALYLLSSCEFLVTSVHMLRPLNDRISIYSVDLSSLPIDFKPLEGLTLEKAAKILNRIDIFEQLRYKILYQINYKENIKMMIGKMVELPEWWLEGEHDIELIKYTIKYGLKVMKIETLLDENYEFSKYTNIVIKKLEEENKEINIELILNEMKWPKPRIILLRIKKIVNILLQSNCLDNDIENNEKYKVPSKSVMKQVMMVQNLLEGNYKQEIVKNEEKFE